MVNKTFTKRLRAASKYLKDSPRGAISKITALSGLSRHTIMALKKGNPIGASSLERIEDAIGSIKKGNPPEKEPTKEHDEIVGDDLLKSLSTEILSLRVVYKVGPDLAAEKFITIIESYHQNRYRYAEAICGKHIPSTE